ncbi:MAG: oxygen-independent coproporphyrinogen III oxidase [Rhizobiaceae bacterium]
MPTVNLKKYYDERLPRYTSYPTAPNFSNKIGRHTYADWLSTLDPNEEISLYVHIPFCRSMCWYCGCHTKISKRNEPIIDYLQALQQEIATTGKTISHKAKVRHLHFGGGTPTIIGADGFSQLMHSLRQNFEFSEQSDIAVEIDPRTFTKEIADAFGKQNVTRASLGVQSFDPTVQKAINRIQSYEETANTVSMLRNSGVKSINFDLIYGLPHQTVKSCITTTLKSLELMPDRFSVFGYAHIPSFKTHQKMIDENTLADGEGRLEQAEAIAETLTKEGYRRIGLDHYACPQDDLVKALDSGDLHRNFQGYTTDTCQTLIGLGASSIGQFPQGYVQNNVAMGRYAEDTLAGKLATAKGYELTGEDRMRATIIEQLMCEYKIDLKPICSAHNIAIDKFLQDNSRLDALAKDGLITIEDGEIHVDADTRFIIRNVAASFDAYLGQSGRTHSKTA